MLIDFHIVVSVDPQYLLDNVSFQLYVHPVCRNLKKHCLIVFPEYLKVKQSEYPLNCVPAYLFPDETVDVREAHFGRCIPDFFRVNVYNTGAYLAACELLHQDGCPFQGPDRYVWISSPFKSERGIRLKGMPFGGFSY